MALNIFILVTVLTILIHPLKAAPAEDEIVNLPGLPYQPSFKQYSGYLNATNGRHFFYWFTEAQNVDPATAPTVFWLNGGPGCSSVDGLLTENGPFSVNDDRTTLSYNPYAWNMLANVIFLESPAGVGYSYADDQSAIPTNDDEVAADNYAAVASFYEKFPEYLPNQLFITGESYAGVYIPTLSYLLLNGTNNYNFQGIAIGNGLHEYKLNYNTEIMFYATHGLCDLTVTKSLLTYCCAGTTPERCDFYDSTDPDCVAALLEVSVGVDTSGVNPYGIYDTCDYRTLGNKLDQGMFPKFRPLPKSFTKEQVTLIQNLRADAPCGNSITERTWINQESVRTALHVPDFVQQWESCSDIVSLTYQSTYESLAPLYPFLLSRLRILLYNGDSDTVCNFIGGEYFAENLGLDILEPYHPWLYENQAAGFMKAFSNLTFVTVLGSGHMVPTDRPQQSLLMINNFIYDLPFMVD